MKKNDKFVIIGIILGFGFIFYAILMGSTPIGAFIDFNSLLIVIGGSFAALITNFSIKELKNIGKYTAYLLRDCNKDKIQLIDMFVELSKKARKEGLLALEEDIEKIEIEFLQKGMKMIVDGVEEDLIRDILEKQIYEEDERGQEGAKFFKQWSTYAPAFGMIGTLIGLIQILGSIESIDALVSGMAVALITTLYGSMISNILLTPISEKISLNSKKIQKFNEIQLKGILAIKAAKTPKVIKEILGIYLTDAEAERLDQEQKDKKAGD